MSQHAVQDLDKYIVVLGPNLCSLNKYQDTTDNKRNALNIMGHTVRFVILV